MTYIVSVIRGLLLAAAGIFYGNALGVLLNYENKVWACIIWVSLILSGCFILSILCSGKKQRRRSGRQAVRQ